MQIEQMGGEHAAMVSGLSGALALMSLGSRAKVTNLPKLPFNGSVP